MATGALAGLVDFVAGFVAACAALPVVDLVGVATLATLAAFADLVILVALANFSASARVGFATRVAFAAFLPGTGVGFDVALARVVVAGAVSHSVACFAAIGCAFFADVARVT